MYFLEARRALSKNLSTGYFGEIYFVNWFNVSSNQEIQIIKLIDVISEITNQKIKPIYKDKREGDIYRSCLDNTRIIEKLGWRPKIELKEGLKLTIEAEKNV